MRSNRGPSTHVAAMITAAVLLTAACSSSGGGLRVGSAISTWNMRTQSLAGSDPQRLAVAVSGAALADDLSYYVSYCRSQCPTFTASQPTGTRVIASNASKGLAVVELEDKDPLLHDPGWHLVGFRRTKGSTWQITYLAGSPDSISLPAIDNLEAWDGGFDDLSVLAGYWEALNAERAVSPGRLAPGRFTTGYLAVLQTQGRAGPNEHVVIRYSVDATATRAWGFKAKLRGGGQLECGVLTSVARTDAVVPEGLPPSALGDLGFAVPSGSYSSFAVTSSRNACIVRPASGLLEVPAVRVVYRRVEGTHSDGRQDVTDLAKSRS